MPDSLLLLLPLKLCGSCAWNIDIPHEGLHCYMFKDNDASGFCAQFRVSDHAEQEDPADA